VTDYLRDPWGSLHTVGHRAAGWLADWGPIAAPTLLIAVLGLLAVRRWWGRRRAALLAADARVVAVRPPPQADPAGAGALWANLVGLLRPAWRRAFTGQPHLAFEYLFDPEGMRIQLWVPGLVPPGLVERAVQAAWPGAHTRTTPASGLLDLPATPDTAVVVAGGQLRLAASEALPLRTDFGADPVRALLSAPAGLDDGQRAVVAVLARPVTGRRVARARRAGRHLQAGRPARRSGRLLDLLADLLTPGPSRHRAHHRAGSGTAADPQAVLEASAANRAVVGKLAGPLYETLVRYAVTAAVPAGAGRDELRRVRDVLRGRAHAVASAFSLYAGHNSYRRTRLRRPLPLLASRRLDRGDLLSVDELAGIAHLPLDEQVPGLVRAGANAVPPPPGTPVPGPGVKPLGVADAGPRRPVGLAVADARHHVQVVGVTGAGKTTLIATGVLADVAAGRAAVVVDGSKGDLITALLDRLPAEAAGRVVLFDAADPHPPCLNPLDGPAETAVDDLVSVFSRVFASSWGPRTDDILRAACLTLTTGGTGRRGTLLDLPDLLADPDYRAPLIGRVTDPVLRGFWAWYEQLSDATRSAYTAPLLNKLRALLLRPFVRNAIAAGPSTVDLSTVLDRGGLLLARLPKGVLGIDTSRLVGSLIVAATWQAATARARTPEHRRRDASLVIDECQNFLNLPYPLEEMLAEARGYRLSMVLAHQHLAQLGGELAEGISANARNKVFFTASPEDARRLARHVTPRLTERDLAHLDAYHAAARLVLAGAQAPAFTFTTVPLGPAIPGRARLIRAAARAHTRPGRPPDRRARGDVDPRRAA
jgi:hypothetical protein